MCLPILTGKEWMIMSKIKELFKKADMQILRLKKYIEENKDMFKSMNLKLYDANYYEYDEMKKDFPLCYKNNNEGTENSYFSMFCRDTYDLFIEWCKEQDIDFQDLQNYIGRTSSFYLYSNKHGRFVFDIHENEINWGDTIGTIYDELGYLNFRNLIEFNENGYIDEEATLLFDDSYYTEEQWIDEIIPAVNYIINEMYDDFIKEMENIKKVYEYIKNTKENQVKYFKEYLEIEEADLQDEKDKCDEEIRKRNEIIMKMPEKIRSIMNRSQLDSEDLNLILSCM